MQEDKNKQSYLELQTTVFQWILKTCFPDRVRGRNTINDGLENVIELCLLTNFKVCWNLAQKNKKLKEWLNKSIINRATNKADPRPYRLTTWGHYTSWDSLTDRSFSGRHLPPSEQENLPDLEEVKNLFLRESDVVESEKSSLLFSYFVQWFADGFLVIDENNSLKNKSTHNLDLSPLYGFTPEETKNLRLWKDGRLKSQYIVNSEDEEEEYPCYYYLENDVYTDSEGSPLQSQHFPKLKPPKPASLVKPEKLKKLFAMGKMNGNVQIGFVIMNTLFLREHNRICQELKGKLGEELPEDWVEDWQDAEKRDERLFQTARNILIVLLLKIVIEEYVNHITPYHFKFILDPLSFTKERWYRQNWMAVEFNLLYRWHSLVPNTINLGQDTTVPISETLWETDLVIHRGLGCLFEAASSQPAGKIGLRNTPSFLIDREKTSLEVGRKARLRSYNDYREMCGLPKVTDFDQIIGTRDPVTGKVNPRAQFIQEKLRDLYKHDVNNIELYTGLFAEEPRPNSAIAPLMARLIVIDAFSQVFTNPLLAETVFSEKGKDGSVVAPSPKTFSSVGCDIIKNTCCLSDILHRNSLTDKHFQVSLSLDKHRTG